jgi:pimeloyl-ACP methyl ester carboxylesterase
VFGDGPVELVFVPPYLWHVELVWTAPEFKAFFDQLATFCRVLVFDEAGVGLSDPVARVRSLDDRAAEIEAVMDAVGFGKAVLFGMSEGGRHRALLSVLVWLKRDAADEGDEYGVGFYDLGIYFVDW